ncbi:VraH family peptide resistance protein [Staphylococcus epidermidis]|uniref:VraH family peptide resistance protein n=1 Tax=Staphylococcus epidermidis TaxID=1282 RepID=UPI0001F4926D|nr:hypothetical protein [Staphylococcus epidermidis]EFV88757.1 conserved hypothetical protein [Staphylococcus epidermidis FRI909]
MSVKHVLKQSWEDLKNLELNFKNVSIVVVVTFILSNILTPLVGIPVGLLSSAYWIQNRKRKQS